MGEKLIDKALENDLVTGVTSALTQKGIKAKLNTNKIKENHGQRGLAAGLGGVILGVAFCFKNL